MKPLFIAVSALAAVSLPAMTSAGQPVTAVLSLEQIDRTIEARVESADTLKAIDALCEEMRALIKVSVGRVQSIKTRSLVYCGTAPFAGVHDRARTGGFITYVGLKIHVDHDSKWTPDSEHTALVLIAVRTNLWIEDGRIAYDTDTSIADIRTKGKDFMGIGNREGKLKDSLNAAVSDKLADRIREDLGKALGNKFDALPVRSLHVSDQGLSVQVGLADPKTQNSSVTMSSKATPLVDKSVLLGCSSPNDAVLKATFYREDMLLHAATLGKEGVGPEPVMNQAVKGKGNFWPHEREHQEDKKSPGRHRVTIYLGQGYETRDLGGVPELRLGGSWNDHAAVVVLEAGPKWDRHSLFLTEHPLDRPKGDKSWGRPLMLSPGVTCFDLKAFAFTNKATGMSVSRPK